MKTKTITCTCFGSGLNGRPNKYYDAMKKVGRLLAKKGVTIITGGYGGPGMKAPLEGASEVLGSKRRGILLNKIKESNIFLTQKEICKGKNLESQWGTRLGKLLGSDVFILDSSGQIGTLIELLSFFNCNKKFWKGRKKLAILFLEAGKANNMLITIVNMLLCSDFIPNGDKESIKICSSPEEAVKFVLN